MRSALFVIAAAILVGCTDTQTATTPRRVTPVVANRIPKSQLEEMFSNIRRDSKWNLDGDMLWGYSFTDPDRKALQRAAEKLESAGYRYVDLFQPEADGKPLPYFFLHVEKVETHDVESLYKRNTELEAFAKQNDLDTYDGMDVGPVTPPASGG